jgi:hypothetical protein
MAARAFTAGAAGAKGLGSLGSGCSFLRRLVLGSVAVLAAATIGLAMSCVPAQAEVTHKYLPALQLSGFEQPIAVAVDTAGEVYVADREAGTVDRFSVDGAPLPFSCGVTCSSYVEGAKLTGTPTERFALPSGVAVDDETKDVYVADENVVDVFSSSGKYLSQLTGTCENSGKSPPSCAGFTHFGSPQGLAFNQSTHELYVADKGSSVVDVFSAAGAYLAQIGVGILTEESSVTCSEVSKNVYIGDGEVGAVNVFEATGVFLPPPWIGESIEGTPNKSFGSSQISVAVDPLTGRVLIANNEFKVVDEFAASATEEYVGQLTGTPTGEGGAVVPFETVRGLAVDPSNGDLYVVAGTSVDVFGPDVIAPDVTIGAASSVGENEVTVGGSVNPDGVAITSCEFEYGTSLSYGQSVECEEPDAGEIGGGSAPVTVHAKLKGLAANTTYHFRLKAGNAEESSVSGDALVVTPGPPIIGEVSALDVSDTGVKFQAQINPVGSETTYSVEYGTTLAYGESVPVPAGSAGSGSSVVGVEAEAQGLQPDTTYHYRVVARNSLGPSYSEDQTFTTQTSGSKFELPDGREWELVSPPDKHGSSIYPMLRQGGVIQAAEAGGAITYIADGPVGSNPQGNRALELSQALSKRGPDGWSTEDLTTPNTDIGELDVATEYKWFSPDLSLGLVEPAGETPLPPLPANAEKTIYLRHDSECEPTATEAIPPTCYQALVTAANVREGAKLLRGPNAGETVEFEGATADLSHVVLSSEEALTTDAVAGDENLYEWSAGKLALVSLLPRTKEEEEKGEAEKATSGVLGLRVAETSVVKNAVSSDGSRIIWGGGGHLYMRDTERGETVQLDVPEAGVAGGGESRFQAASSDDSRVFFTDSEPLTVGAGPGALYVCTIVMEAGKQECDLSELAAGIGNRVVGASEDGSELYFVSGGKMTLAQESAGKWSTRTIATLSSEDGPDSDNEIGGDLSLAFLTARVSPDGRYLAFMSNASLTGYDNVDANPDAYEHEYVHGKLEVVYRDGKPVPARDEEVYLFDSVTGGLSCVSCAVSGARPAGVFDPGAGATSTLLVDEPGVWEGRWLAGSIPGWTGVDENNALYQSRYLSDDGRLFFDSPVDLVSGAVNGREDVYEYEPEGVGPSGVGCGSGVRGSGVVYKPARRFVVEGGGVEPAGCVGLISSGSSVAESAFLDASGVGPGGEEAEDVFFVTAASLVPGDEDSIYDVYDAHTCSLVSPCVAPVVSVPSVCAGAASAEACRPAPGVQPSLFEAPASATFTGLGNLAPVPPVPVVKKAVVKKSLSRAQKLARALAACRRKPKRKRAACEKQARRAYGPPGKAKKAGKGKKSSVARRPGAAKKASSGAGVSGRVGAGS